MNDLNSILLEGTVTKDPVFSHDKQGKPRCLLAIESEHYLKRADKMEKRTTGMGVYVEGKLAETCRQLCHQGRKIRVVGSLQIMRGTNMEGRDTAQVVIDAKHIEVKPELSVKQEEEQSYDNFSR
jgi:single-strand DNA-binding protein